MADEAMDADGAEHDIVVDSSKLLGVNAIGKSLIKLTATCTTKFNFNLASDEDQDDSELG